MAEILVVDDDQSVASAFKTFLRYEGHDCRIASSAPEAMQAIAERPPALVVMDVRMPGVDGLAALKEMRAKYPDLYVVMMTGYGTSQTSIDAIRDGAFDFLHKPLDLDELRGVIRKALAARESRDTSESPAAVDAGTAPSLVGEAPAMREVYKTIGRLAALDVPALLVGEHGTGKRLVAATIHANSARRARPFVVVDCAASPELNVDEQMALASGGTLLLQHIEALAPAAQAALVKTLGRTSGRSAGAARLLAATEADLRALAASGAFNRELVETLAVVTVALPPLRNRRDDIPLLVRAFIQRFNVEFERGISRMDDALLRRLQEHPWPGNVAELEGVVKRGCILARSEVITADDIGGSLTQAPAANRQEAESSLSIAAKRALQERLIAQSPNEPSSAYHDIIDLVETTLVKEALLVTNGNQVKAALILGVNRATLRKKMPGA
ncbi:MAG: sigma-54-dependent Fis family transcriptional regulator [Acidobacteria bacterium]|nr:sigma-54-dependent Fis family transcriptional regulator [Acidobacteriota bacterium]